MLGSAEVPARWCIAASWRYARSLIARASGTRSRWPHQPDQRYLPMPADRDDYNERTARIRQMLEELRLNTADLHELAKQATDPWWQIAPSARTTANDVRALSDSCPTKETREP